MLEVAGIDHRAALTLLPVIQSKQLRITTPCDCIVSAGLLRGETLQIVWPTSFGAGPRQALSAEGIYSHHRANHIAIDIGVANTGLCKNVPGKAVDTAVYAEGETIG